MDTALPSWATGATVRTEATSMRVPLVSMVTFWMMPLALGRWVHGS